MTGVEERVRGIGRMARESGLTVSALRFYDGAGVLVPAAVDPRSGYRWYSDDQVPVARLVARLRRVGMPLADIGRVLAHRHEPPVADRLLQAHLERLEQGLADARRELSAARSLLDLESPVTTLHTTAGELRRALSAVRHAVGGDPELPMLTGVLLDAEPTAVRVVATDRYRLAVRLLPDADLAGPAVSVILPVALVDEVLAASGGDADPATVGVEGDQVTVALGTATMQGRRLDADFPDYRRVLRPAAATEVGIDVAAFRAELAAATTRTVADESGAEHTVSVLRLTDDGSVGFAEEGTAVLEVGLNREFLLEALDAGGGQLVLDLDGPLAPLALRDPARADDLVMVMPVRLP